MLKVTNFILLLVSTSVAVPALSDGQVLNSDLYTNTDSPQIRNLSHEPLHPIPLHTPTDQNAADLGRRLFHDQRLAKNGKLSCADCHNLKLGGADAKPVHGNINIPHSSKNTPTIFNVIFNKAYYWDAQFASLDKQTDDSLKELGVTWEQLTENINNIIEYRARFESLFRDGVTSSNIKKTLIAYEYTLTTPNARFDQYLRGNQQAINNSEKKGYELFKSYGCAACHQGINVGGNLVIFREQSEFDNHNPLIRNIPSQNNGISLTNRGETKIRVPSLRNVALTAPYYHDGSVNSLDHAVAKMANEQLGISLPYRDIERIVLFLHTLTGEYNGKAL